MFMSNIKDLERQLANIICQGFDDCPGIEAIFKVYPYPSTKEVCLFYLHVALKFCNCFKLILIRKLSFSDDQYIWITFGSADYQERF